MRSIFEKSAVKINRQFLFIFFLPTRVAIWHGLELDLELVLLLDYSYTNKTQMNTHVSVGAKTDADAELLCFKPRA